MNVIDENKLIRENLRILRKILLSEAVGDQDLIDAINNHEIIYIAYDGEDNKAKGFRTIRPFLLGTNKNGNKVLRAWQEAGNSESYGRTNLPPRQNHEYGFNEKGARRPGWRLFRVDQIATVLPTGRKFSPENLISKNTGSLYNNPEKGKTNADIVNVIAGIPKMVQKFKVQNIGNLIKPDVTQQAQPRFRQFFKPTAVTKEPTKQDVEQLLKLAKEYKFKRTGLNNILVIQNEKGNFILREKRKAKNVPQEAIVGTLKDLYNKYVVPNKPIDRVFFNQQKQDFLKNK